MSQLLLVFLCLILGIVLKRTGKFPLSTPQSLNAFVIWISLPALVFVHIDRLLKNTSLSLDMLIPVSMAWILFPISVLVFYFLGKKLKWSQTRTGALMLTAGLGNTSFVGFPLLEALHGPEALPIGVLVDQLGSFLVLSTLGLLVAGFMSSRKGAGFSFASALKNVFCFPPFVALVASFAMGLLGFGWPAVLLSALGSLANTLVPLALVSVGFQLNPSRAVLQKEWRPLLLGLGFKLVFAPLVFLGLFVFALGKSGFVTRITILESAMASMITASVVSDEFGFDRNISSLMLGVGIPLSLVTVYLWDLLLGQIL